ncbi:MAG: DUF4384 domain-containing protein, partial [Bacteroidetes bacterium]
MIFYNNFFKKLKILAIFLQRNKKIAHNHQKNSLKNYISKKIMKKYFLCVLFVGFANLCFSQNEYGRGLLFDDDRYQETPIKAMLMRGDYQNLPKSASLKKYCPIPSNQGQYGTCTGWSTAYAARTIVEAKNNEMLDPNAITQIAFSPNFVYRLAKSDDDHDCSQGAYIDVALQTMIDYGTPKLSDFQVDCPTNIPQNVFEKAKKSKIKDFARIFDVSDSQDSKIQASKKALSEGKPVLIAMVVPPSFNSPKDVWQPYEQPLLSYGGHAMCVIGYDDNRFGGAFEIMNSWGSNWGNRGFIWVKYADFFKYVKYGFEMIAMPKAKPQKPDLSGKISLQLADENPMKSSLKANSGIYKTVSGYESGTKFRLLISNNEPAFVYAFGSDLSNKSYQIFPHKKGVSAALTFKQNNVAIPSEDHFIKMDNRKGTDFLCVLYSKEPLKI